MNRSQALEIDLVLASVNTGVMGSTLIVQSCDGEIVLKETHNGVETWE